MEPETKARLTNKNIWSRLLYMVLYAIAYGVAESVLFLVVLFQFLAALFTGSANRALLQFGNNLSAYVYQILQFQTFNDETHPWPLSDWPDDEPGVTPWTEPNQDSDDTAATAPAPADESVPEDSARTDDTVSVDPPVAESENEDGPDGADSDRDTPPAT